MEHPLLREGGKPDGADENVSLPSM